MPRIPRSSVALRLNSEEFKIVGVAPRKLVIPFTPEMWVPLRLTAEDKKNRTDFSYYGWALLKPGVTAETAKAELNTIAAQIARENPDTNTGRGAEVWTTERFVAGVAGYFLWMEAGAALMVLLIACANVANLQLAQGAVRRRELVLRSALGAGRWRLARQLFTESLVLALAGAIVAVIFAQWALELVIRTMPGEVKRFVVNWDGIALNGRSLLFATAAAVCCAVVSALIPVLRSMKPDLQSTLRETAGASPSGRRVRTMLVVAEVTLSVVLLAGAALMARGFSSLLSLGQMHAPSSLLTFRLSRPPAKDDADALRNARMYAELQRRIGALPRVQHVSAATFLPHSQRSTDEPFTIENQPPRNSSETPVARLQSVLPEYFRTMQIPVLQGRPVDERDTAAAEPAVVISKSLADRYFSGRDPIGQRIRVGHSNDGKWWRVAGVAADVVHNWFDDNQTIPTMYRSLDQVPRRAIDFAVRASGDPLALAPSIRAEVSRLDPELPMVEVRTMEAGIYDSFTGLRYGVWVIAFFSVLAAAIAMVGIYAVLSYTVAERTHEIGIRVALGASAGQVRWSVLMRSLAAVTAGMLAGLAGAAVLARAMSYYLFGVTPGDATSYAGVAAAFLLTAALASWLPARRATQVDPIIALRNL